jgi:hypothetical protein
MGATEWFAPSSRCRGLLERFSELLVTVDGWPGVPGYNGVVGIRLSGCSWATVLIGWRVLCQTGRRTLWRRGAHCAVRGTCQRWPPTPFWHWVCPASTAGHGQLTPCMAPQERWSAEVAPHPRRAAVWLTRGSPTLVGGGNYSCEP